MYTCLCTCKCMRAIDGVIGSLSTIYGSLWLSFCVQFYLQFNNLPVIHCNRHIVQSVYNWLATVIFDVVYGLMLVGWLEL